MPKPNENPSREASFFSLLQPYMGWIVLLVVLTVAGSALGLIVPQLMSHAIDAYTAGTLDLTTNLLWFSLVALGIFIVLNLQSVVQTFASEIVARDLRTKVASAISVQEYAAIET